MKKRINNNKKYIKVISGGGRGMFMNDAFKGHWPGHLLFNGIGFFNLYFSKGLFNMDNGFYMCHVYS